MLRIFTLKFEEKLEGFDDSRLCEFLAGKELVRWESHLITTKNDHYWTILLEYLPAAPASPKPSGNKVRKKSNESYKDIMTEQDWPLFKSLREWRGETSKKEGVPPYILFTNLQLAKIATTRPTSLNALQGINGIGNAKREKYGNDVLKIVKNFNHQGDVGAGEENRG